MSPQPQPTRPTPLAFARYVRLYTLHQIEQPGDLFVLRLRIETLRYSFAPLIEPPSINYPRPMPNLDAIYVGDPASGAQQVRDAVLPRLQALLDARDPFGELALLDNQQHIWQRYAAERGLPAQPGEVPGIKLPAPHPRRQLPAISKTSQRLATLQRGLETLHTAAQTAATLAALWQNWQIGRAQRALLDTQRALLQDTIQAQLSGQNQALNRALDQDFVRGYLADHNDDPAHDIVFGD